MTEVRAPAKLTLGLRIVGRRTDGYHLLEAEMITISLADTLRFAPGDGLVLVDEVQRGSPVSTGPDNLVQRALALAGRRSQVTLHKRIPAGGGLGGGSADAAAVLRWAGCTDLAQAARLGADVPFCLIGGYARVTGIGDVIDPLPFDDVRHRVFTLSTPPFGVSTVEVYRTWDRLATGGGDGPNDLEAAALAVEPRLALWRDHLSDATGQRPVLAGSGSTWFIEGDHPGPDRTVVRPVLLDPTPLR